MKNDIFDIGLKQRYVNLAKKVQMELPLLIKTKTDDFLFYFIEKTKLLN